MAEATQRIGAAVNVLTFPIEIQHRSRLSATGTTAEVEQLCARRPSLEIATGSFDGSPRLRLEGGVEEWGEGS